MDHLWEAVFYNQDIQKARYLLENRANSRIYTEYQRSPLQTAASDADIKMMGNDFSRIQSEI